jgi:hypothetical protein
MHRSGTSALARVLNLLGCSLPSTLIGANDSNPAGHWESDVIRELNDEILALAGRSWRDWRVIDPAFFDTLPARALTSKAATLIDREFGASALFVLKDPRTSILLPFWLRTLQSCNITPQLLLPVRHPFEVARSLAKRDGMEEGIAQLIWLRYLLDAEFSSRGMTRKFTTYDGLLEDWRSMVEAAGVELGINWPRSTSTCDKQVREFLALDLRHHKLEPKRLERDERVLAWSRDAYQILSGWADRGEAAADYERLDAIRIAFDNSTRLLDPVFSAADDASVYLQGKQAAEQRLDLAVHQNEVAHQELAAATAEVAELARARDAAEQQFTASATLLAEMENRLREQSAEAAKERLQAEQQHAALFAAINADLSKANQQIAMLEARLATQIEDHRIARELDLVHANSRLEVVTEERDGALSDVTRWEARVAALSSENRELNERLAEAHLELAELAKLQVQIDAYEQEAALAEQASEIATRARRIALTMQDQPWWTPLLPGSRSARLERQLAQAGVFDAEQYLLRYPDVAEGLLPPLKHYLRHGMDEERIPI